MSNSFFIVHQLQTTFYTDIIMRKTLVIFASLLLLSPVFALQTIRGKIVDGKTVQPLDFVNVTLLKGSDTTPTTGVISDEKGQFELPKVPNGNYILKISFVGYNTIEMPIRVTENDLNMGVIKLMEDSKTLSEVEVVAQGTQMRFEIDKKVFSVDQNIAAAGGSATEVLQNIPSVDVDNEGNISLRNSENVEVWINGKPSGLTAENRAQILQQMPAESLESVEIMTNPSAKFNPEGTAGIINLVMKKNRKAGYYGSLSAGTMWSQGALPGYNVGANLNFNKGRWDAYVNLGYRNMKFFGGGKSDRFSFDTNTADTISLLSQTNDRLFGYQSLFMRAGADYRLHDNHTIGISGFGMTGRSGGYSDINYNFNHHVDNALSKNYNRYNESNGERPGLNINLDYKWDVDKKGSNLMSSISYSTHKRQSAESYLQTMNAGVDTTSYILQDNQGQNTSIQLKVDYTHKFTENDRLETGWQSTWQNRFGPNSAKDLLTNNELYAYFNEFQDNENVHAGYVTYGSRIKNLSLQGGLRAEYFERSPVNSTKDNAGNIITTNYDKEGKIQLFPSFFASYSFPNDHELQFNASRRVNRPRGRQINPFRDYSDSTNISYGNLALTPMYSAALELNYLKSWEKHTISSSIYHRYTDDVIQRVSFMNNGVMESTFMNVTKSANTGFEFVVKNNLFRILNLTTSLNLYHGKIYESTYISPYDPSKITTIPEQQNFSWSARMIGNIMLSKTSSAQITGHYASPRLLAQGETFANYAVDLGYRHSFFNRNLNINVSIRDLFNTRSWRSTTWGEGFYQTSENSFSRRMIGITATYNFGNMKPKRPKSQQMESGSGDMDGGGFDEY